MKKSKPRYRAGSIADGQKFMAIPLLLWSIMFILLPLAVVLYNAFLDPSGGFSLDAFRKVFSSDGIYLHLLLSSLWLAVESTLICLLLGYPLAYILSRHASASVMILVFILPMWMNFLLRTYSWLAIHGKNGILNSLFSLIGLPGINILNTRPAVVLGMIYNFLPFMVLPIYNSLNKIDPSLIEASGDLGASEGKTFLKVVLPLSIPGVYSGISMVFLPAVTTFVIPSLLGGGKVDMIGNIIESQFLKTNNWAFGSALSLILMVLIFAFMKATSKYNTEENERGGLI